MLGKLANNILKPFGLRICAIENSRDLDLEDELFLKIYEKVRAYTMTSITDVYSLYTALNFITENKIEGDFVECGVWKGGCSMFMANYLVDKSLADRRIYLYDTFSGMTDSGSLDIDLNGKSASTDNVITWEPASLEEVKENMSTTNYPLENIVFIEGDISKTLKDNTPNKISLLRLDTDWYESTKSELKYLYPKLTTNGVLILDDHGHWLGARKAAEEYFAKSKEQIFLSKVNYSTRLGIKLS